jgi:NADPH:quinone reductase-like Zn-dependent oxidoreductase
MDAAVLTEPGTPRFGDFAEPVAREGEVVVEVSVAGLNPVDLAMASGRFPVPLEFPCVAGREGVGRTADGRRVYFSGPVAPYGSLAPRTLVDADALFDVPRELADDAVAVALGIAGLAAWLPLTYRADLQPGESVLVLGATGVLGTIAVQAAKRLGAGRVVAAGRDAAGLERVRALGADAVVDLGAAVEDDLAETLREAAGGGIDVTIDPLWGAPAVAALAALNVGGRHVQIGNSAGAEVTLTPSFRQAMGSVLGYTTRHVPREAQRAAYRALAEEAASGGIVVETERVPLREIEAAWARQAAHPHHKLVVEP